MERITGENVKAALTKHVRKDARIVTDELPTYIKPASEFASHDRIRHGVGEYVRGDVHTNTVEGFFSLLKRGIVGSFHHVGKGHLFRYCGEFAFRYNTRAKLGYSDGERAALIVTGAEGKRLTYKQPTGSSAN